MARIDTSSIDGYESMSAEEKLAALESFEYEDNTAKYEQMKSSFDRASKEAADWKKKHNQLLSDDERQKQEKDEELSKMQKELEELRREKYLSNHEAKALALGMDEKTAKTVSEAIVDGKFETMFDTFAKFLKTHDHEIEVNLLKDTPRATGGEGEHAMTLAEFKKLGTDERAKFALEHPDQYEELYKT